jgi:2-keto-3-deoxy-L-rhamnonate aldolase RhmA
MGGGPIMANLYAVDGGPAQVPEAFSQALRTIVQVAQRNGKFAGIQVGTGSAAASAARDGFDYVGIGGDTGFLQAGGQDALAEARAGIVTDG